MVQILKPHENAHETSGSKMNNGSSWAHINPWTQSDIVETFSWTQENAHSKRLIGFEVTYKCFYEKQDYPAYNH